MTLSGRHDVAMMCWWFSLPFPYVSFHNTWDVSKIFGLIPSTKMMTTRGMPLCKRHTSTTKRSSVTTCCIRCRMSFRVGFPEHCSGDERHHSIISISFIHPITTCGWRIHSVFPTLPIYIIYCIYIYVCYYNSSTNCFFTYVCMLDILNIYI